MTWSRWIDMWRSIAAVAYFDLIERTPFGKYGDDGAVAIVKAGAK